MWQQEIYGEYVNVLFEIVNVGPSLLATAARRCGNIFERSAGHHGEWELRGILSASEYFA